MWMPRLLQRTVGSPLLFPDVPEPAPLHCERNTGGRTGTLNKGITMSNVACPLAFQMDVLLSS
eukprot:348099-Pyramimonas_sp.AAC.1